jgi:hypothetical protein
MQARIRSMPRRRAERYLRELAGILETEESIRLLYPTRPPAERLAQHKAQDQAAAWLRSILPVLIASLPRE